MEKCFVLDEKKLTLMVLMGCQRYWHDEGIAPGIFSTKYSGEVSIMVWGAFSYRETMKPQVVQERQNAAGYIGMLELSSLFTEGACLCGGDRIFNRIMPQFTQLVGKRIFPC